ncbi:hypothetical protein B5F87_10095 [Eubacterium sp. An3]|nr:hypothetical protein B5F87_10095 [Eubacterium sp. An3]
MRHGGIMITYQGRSTTTVSAGVVIDYKKKSGYQPAEVEEAASLTAFFYGTYKAANPVCSFSSG